MAERLHNQEELRERRRALRSNATPAEAALWKLLKKSQLGGRKFKRQHSIGPYIVDFYCPAEKLAVELDGPSHRVSFPFTNITISGRKPPGSAYPAALETIGDHMRKRRLDLRLFQREVAKRIGVTADTITNWELNRTEPEIRYIPALLDFLGYVPFSPGASFPERLRAYRMIRGLSQRQLARQIGVDEGTLRKWEAGKSQPSRKLKGRVAPILNAMYG